MTPLEFLIAHQLLVIVLVVAVTAGVVERWMDRRGARSVVAAMRRTPYLTGVESVQSEPAPHWVRVEGVDSFRPVCRTCPWSGAAVIDRGLAVAAGREHGEVAS